MTADSPAGSPASVDGVSVDAQIDPAVLAMRDAVRAFLPFATHRREDYGMAGRPCGPVTCVCGYVDTRDRLIRSASAMGDAFGSERALHNAWRKRAEEAELSGRSLVEENTRLTAQLFEATVTIQGLHAMHGALARGARASAPTETPSTEKDSHHA